MTIAQVLQCKKSKSSNQNTILILYKYIAIKWMPCAVTVFYISIETLQNDCA